MNCLSRPTHAHITLVIYVSEFWFMLTVIWLLVCEYYCASETFDLRDIGIISCSGIYLIFFDVQYLVCGIDARLAW